MAHFEIDPSLLKSLSIKPHSVRHVATSLNVLKHFSLDDLIAPGTWTSSNVFLSHYIQNFTTDELSRLHRFGGFVAPGTAFLFLCCGSKKSKQRK